MAALSGLRTQSVIQTVAIDECVFMCLGWELKGKINQSVRRILEPLGVEVHHFPDCSPLAWSSRISNQVFRERASSWKGNGWKEEFIFWWKAIWKDPPQVTCLTTYRFKCVNILFCILNKYYIMGTDLYYTVYGIIKKLFHYFYHSNFKMCKN